TILSHQVDGRTALVMVPWLLLVVASELSPILYLPDITLSLSMPLILAAGMTLGPLPAGILGFLGAWDRRYLRKEVTFAREMFNRGQVALSSMAGTVAFFAVGGSLDDWPWVVVACFAAIVVDVLLNVTLVAIGIYLGPRTPMSKIVRGV